MTWSTLQVSPEASGTALTITPTFPGGTTAGTLLTCELLVSNATDSVTLPAGWVQREVMNSNGANRVEIWDYLYNPGGITSVIITDNTSSRNMKATLAEHQWSVPGAIIVPNASGNGKAGTVSSLAISTTGNAQAGDLAVCVFEEHFVTAAAVTWTTPSGWSTIGSDSASAGNHLYSAYLPSVASTGTLTVTGSTGTAADNTNGWSGAIVTYSAQGWVLTQQSASQGTTASGTTVHGTLPASSSGSGARAHLVVAHLTANANGTFSLPTGWAFANYEYYGNNVTATLYFIDTGGTHAGTSTTFTFSNTAKLTAFVAEYDPGINGVVISLNNSVKATHGAGASSLSASVSGANAGDLAVLNAQEYFEVSSSFAQTWYDAAYSGWVYMQGIGITNPAMLGYGHAWTGTEISTIPGSTEQMPFWDSKSVQGNGATAAAIPTNVCDIENGDITAASDVAAWINARNALTGGYAANRPTIYYNKSGSYTGIPATLWSTYGLLPGRDYDIWIANWTGSAPSTPYAVVVNGTTYYSVATQYDGYSQTGASYDISIAFDQTWFNAFGAGLSWTTPSGWTTVGSEGSAAKNSHQYCAHNLSVAAGTVSVTASSSITSQSAHGWSGVASVFTTTLPGGATGSFSITLPVLTPSLSGSVSGTGVGAPSVVNVWPISSTNDYGLQYAEVSNSPGNGLVAILGLGNNSQATLPRFNVADDAHNFWTYCGTRENITATLNRRVDVWVAPNASAAEIVSVSESWFTNGIAGVILEVENFPEYAQIDFVAPAGGYGTSASPGATADTADVVFGALLISGAGTTVTVVPPAGFSSVSTVTTGSSSTDQTSQVLYPMWGTTTAGPFGPVWSWSGNQHYESVVVGFNLTPTAPAQANPNWPVLMVEAAFGFEPGNVGQMPVWTDITTRVQDVEGTSVLQASRGREYELTQPEAGELSMWMDNHDGALNPLNAASPFYPYVLPEVPVQASAFWNGKQYGIAYAYSDKWPQNFRDPQWGETNYSGSDTLGVAANVTLNSAYQADVLIDQPYALFPLGEQYNDANGEPFNNASRTNLIPAYGIDDLERANGHALATGQTLGLAADSGTGIGLASGSTTNAGGPGALYYDPNMPQLANGFTLEFWAIVPHVSATTAPCSIAALEGPPSNYAADVGTYTGTGDGARLNVVIENDNTVAQTLVTLTDFQGLHSVVAQTSHPTAAGLHHFVVTANYSGSTWTVAVYIDGDTFGNVATGTTVASNPTTNKLCLGPLSLSGGIRPSVPYTIGMAAIYGYVLDLTRVAAHYLTGATAASGDTTRQRFAKLNAWGGQGLPIAATVSSPSPLMGNADQIQGQALSDSLNDLATTDGGMAYCDAQGNLWYVSRTWFYNRAPKWTFGDNTQPGIMSDGPNVAACYAVNPSVTQASFNQPGAFISGGNPTTDPRPTGFSQATPLVNYTAYAQLQADLTGSAVVSGGNTYNPRTINSWVHWLRYDIESWSATPAPESADPQTYLGNFIALAHDYGYQVIVTPARDLADTDTAHPKLSGETDDAWYIRTGIPAACAAADILSVQTQADQNSAPEFWWFYSNARSAAKAVNPAIEVWAGLSTTYGTGQGMYQAAQWTGIADGFWLNIIGDTADSVQFMELLQAQPVQVPYIDADFDFSNTYLYNQTGSQRTINASQTTLGNGNGQYTTLKYNQYGAQAIEADQASETEYMPRTALQQNLETTSDQDPYDRANWSLVKYKQPQLRANQILLNPAANPPIFGIALGVEQGDVVAVRRQPLGGVEYLLLCIVQKVEHDIGPSHWLTTLTLAPYYPEGNVLQLDTAPFSNPVNGVLGW